MLSLQVDLHVELCCATDIIAPADSLTASDSHWIQQDCHSSQRHWRPCWWRHRPRDAHLGRHADKGYL